MRKAASLLLWLVLAGSALSAYGTDAARQADVARRGAEVMPFDLKATLHVFTKTPQGGVQRVTARDPSDGAQVKLVRAHLREIRAAFLAGDFSAPEHIHGERMPGLAVLKQAPRGAIAIEYREVPAGAELVYRTRDRRLAAALHDWFDAQVSDHGADAMAGHPAHHHPAR